MPVPAALSLYFTPRMLLILVLGFSSGLPLALTASTLSIWLTETGISMTAIGLFAAVATPYTFKFLWSPLVDGMHLPLLTRMFGRRRGWLLFAQAALILSIIALGFADPAIDPWVTALAAFIVAVCSATHDTVYDAFRVEILKPEEQGTGAAIGVLGYRIGMMASSAGALLLAAKFGWTEAYIIMALCMLAGVAATLLAREPKPELAAAIEQEHLGITQWLKRYVISPFAEFMTRPGWVAVLLFILLFRFGEAFLGVMSSPFFIQIGFVKGQVAAIVKFYGLIATIAGSLLGGWLVYKLGILRALWLGGFLQAASNLFYLALLQTGPDVTMLGITITVDNICGGICTSAFVAYLSSLCNLRYTATQYALLSSLASFARTFMSTPAGYVVDTVGWAVFFMSSIALAIPGLVLLYWLQRKFP